MMLWNGKGCKKNIHKISFCVSLYLWHHSSLMAEYSNHKHSSQSLIIPISSFFTHPQMSLNPPYLSWHSTIYQYCAYV